MRSLLFLFLCGFISCKTKIEKNALLGSWMVLQDESKYPKADIIDKLTFYTNDSLKIELIINGKLNQLFSGTYKIDKKKNVIVTKVNSVEVTFEVVALTGKRLILKDYNRNTITNYVRL